ncbi:hypothetical protein ORV05_08910 [Amycolatopsis cynarae]|uniref:GIY-YIG domain-containing protein n=1 Tax=Amycolatopsis cynarae TaxID=2995223 RepID=A0ABY7B7F3_9PSEU|nr:hypothetical protein [Amycolatopsis sp. HUAS 11-8]WAL67874.1 hypothetical protein ORV05_08910 [Amycolatopsis sp. HUAS 11-8]
MMSSVGGVATALECWSEWVDLCGAGRNQEVSSVPGLYRVRRKDDESGLVYIGQTGRSLRGRLGQLSGVYKAEMPYRDPHTAGPALWALRHRDGCDFEASVIEISATVPQRKALEATAVSLYRTASGKSPAANFGRMPSGYRMSTGNNARLTASGQRLRGGPDPHAPRVPGSAPVAGRLGTDPRSDRWMNWPWTSWVPLLQASTPPACVGIYRIGSKDDAKLTYIGQGRIAARLRAHQAKALKPDHRQGPHLSADPQVSWVPLPGTAMVHLLEHENDLIAAHVIATGQAPLAQFLG